MTNTVKANNGKTYALPKNPVWRKGPPPEIGWWPASGFLNVDVLRFWNGERWSDWVRPHRDSEQAEWTKKEKAFESSEIKWTDRWWLGQPKGFPK